MDCGERAVDFFAQGYNCAQSTAAAFAEAAGIDVSLVLKMTAGFGGGVGGQREMCGAVSGMIFVLGLYLGEYDPLDNEAKTKLYRMVRDASEEFKTKFGTTCCRDLLLKANCLPKPNPSVRNAEYYKKRPCAAFVRAAADMAAARIGLL